MHAGFQLVFGGFLLHRFAGAASNSCIFDDCKGLGIATPSPKRAVFVQHSAGWLCCYRDTRLRDDMPRGLNPINTYNER
jgi:hypothetical protein